MTSPQKKRGKLSLEEEVFIASNASKMSIADIAFKLNRTSEPIERYINENHIPSIDNIENLDEEYESLLASLKKKIYWKELEHQLDSEELKYFSGMWVDFMLQFKQDVLASEEYQIKQLIILEILMNRLMRKRLLAKKDIERLSKELEIEYAVPAANRDAMKLSQLEGNLSLAKTADSNMTNEQNKIAQDVKSLYKDLKATRDQRFNKVESGEKTFMTLLKDMYNEEVRRKEGEAAELMRIATTKKKHEMEDYHQFGDNILDMPFLTPEAVLRHKQEEDRHEEIRDGQEQKSKE
jgi:hypothetical protein